MKKLNDLYDAFKHIESKEDFDLLLNDLLTPEEQRFLRERWNIAQMIFDNFTYASILERLNCGTATIARVSKCMDKNNSGYLIALKKINKQKNTNKIQKQ